MALELPRLTRGLKYVNSDGTFAQAFQIYWQRFAQSIETQDASQQAQIDAIEEVQRTSREQSLNNSYVTDASVSASDAGSDVTITIGAHTRNYGNGDTATVDAGVVTGLDYATRYYVYYDDDTRNGGPVTYMATTVESEAAQTSARHTITVLTTPAAAAPDVPGNVPAPPGVRDIDRVEP